MPDVLLLNNDYQPLSFYPLSTVRWQTSITAMINNKVDVVKFYDDWVVHSPTTAFRVPSIIVTKKYCKRVSKLKLTRMHVHLRDNFQCQYCGGHFTRQALTLDHVLPRSKGGKSTWENLVSACVPCNTKKSNRTDIRPKKHAYEPTYFELLPSFKNSKLTIKDRAWLDYLDWPEEKVILAA